MEEEQAREAGEEEGRQTENPLLPGVVEEKEEEDQLEERQSGGTGEDEDGGGQNVAVPNSLVLDERYERDGGRIGGQEEEIPIDIQEDEVQEVQLEEEDILDSRGLQGRLTPAGSGRLRRKARVDYSCFYK